MIKLYKGYKIVDTEGLRGLLHDLNLYSDADFYGFLYANNIFVLQKKKQELISIDYKTLLKKNNQSKIRTNKCGKIVVISDGNCLIDLIESINQNETNLQRETINSVIEKIINKELYVSNLYKLRCYLDETD